MFKFYIIDASFSYKKRLFVPDFDFFNDYNVKETTTADIYLIGDFYNASYMFGYYYWINF